MGELNICGKPEEVFREETHDTVLEFHYELDVPVRDDEECRQALFEYIEYWYYRQRIHSALGYKNPQQMEDEAIRAV